MIDILDPLITVTGSSGLEAYGFRVQEISGYEELGSLFQYHLDLHSKLHDIDLKSLLGKTMTVHVPLAPGQFRHISGMVFQSTRGRRDVNYTEYRVTLLPEQHLLSFSHDCRIFEGHPVIDVVKQVLEEHKLRPYQTSLYEKAYRSWDYLTQYQESDWDFIRRILALEGIYFYFNHLTDGHEMVLADSISSHHARVGWETVPLLPPGRRGAIPDCLRQWGATCEVRTNDVALRDFEFRARGDAAILAGHKGTKPTKDEPTLERYEYPGGFVLAENKDDADVKASNAEGERLARVRLEEKQSSVEVFAGEGTARGLEVGALFGVSELPGLAGRKFMITSTDVVFRNPAPDSSQVMGDKSHVRLTAIDSATPFRMPRIEKPIVRGPQTARVVGGSKEEIWTDKHGRIRVQFHWDRDKDRKPEDKSCWVRVAHPWAGNRWGAVHIPRVGNEVVVEFLEGDPDRPLVTGSVYDADNMPPYDLPQNKTQTGIKTRSTKGGNPQNFNELRFEDLKDSEQVYLQAEKDLKILVKNGETREVGHDRVKKVKNDETSTITGNRTEEVVKDETITIHGNRTETVDKNETITITGARTESVAKDEGITITGARTETVGKNETITITGARQVDVGKADTLTVAAGRTQTITGNDQVTVSKKLVFDAGDEIVIKTGDASITMKKDGTIVLKGKDVSINASGKINAKADGDVIIKGSKVSNN